MKLRKDDFDAEEAVFGWLIGQQWPAGDRGFIELEGMHAAIGVKYVNLAKLLVRVDAHAVVVGGVHDLLREGVILLHCACLAK